MVDATKSLNSTARAFVESQRLRRQELPDLPTVSVTGDFTDEAVTVRRTAITPLTLHGRIMDSGKPVLVPFMHIHIEGMAPGSDPESEPGTLLKGFTTLENAAFVVASLAADLRIACLQTTRSGSDEVGVERKRLEAARIFASTAAYEALTAVALLSRALDAEDDVPTAPREDQPAAKKVIRRRMPTPATPADQTSSVASRKRKQ